VFTVLRTAKPFSKETLVANLRLAAAAPINGLEYYHVRRPLDSLSNFLILAGQPTTA